MKRQTYTTPTGLSGITNEPSASTSSTMTTDTPRTDAKAQFFGWNPDEGEEFVQADFARQLERENAALREERDSYRLRAEQNWGLRKEIQSALNVPYDCEGEEALKQGLAAIKTLRADKERMDWLEASDFWPASLDFWPHHLPQVGGSLRAAIDAERKEAQP